MPSASKKLKFPSELRYDLISKDWVVIATGRAKRPEMFRQEKKEEESDVSTTKCPFCDISQHEKPVLVSRGGRMFVPPKDGKIPNDWTVIVMPNKFPAFIPAKKITEKIEGKFYKKISAVGFHEVVVTRDHKRQIAQFSVAEIKELLDVYQARFLALVKEKFVNFISIFHNHGKGAGASIRHPHSQIITTPLIDGDLRKSLHNSESFFREKGSCIYCLMNQWEMKKKERLVFENKGFFALCPFASKSAFEMIISPKRHLSYFENITEDEKEDLAEVFQVAFLKMYRALNNPDYNFYLHTAPADGGRYPSYHWHWTIIPKTSTPAGFEIGTRMEISTIEPEKAAAYLRSIKL